MSGLVAISGDGTRLVSVSDRGTLRLWRMPSGEPAGQARRQQGRPQALAVTRAGGPRRRRVDGTSDAAVPVENRRGNVVVLDAASGRVLTEIATQAVPFSIAFTPDGTRLVCGLRVAPAQTDAGIASTVIYDARTGGHVASLAVRHENGVTVAVSPDGTRLITAGSTDQTLRIWDAHRYELLLTIRVQPDRLRSLAVSPDGNRIAAGTWNGAVYVWDAEGRARDPVPGIQTGDRR